MLDCLKLSYQRKHTVVEGNINFKQDVGSIEGAQYDVESGTGELEIFGHAYEGVSKNSPEGILNSKTNLGA